MLTRYLKAGLLIIDDMGMKELSRRSGETLFEIIMRRYETRSTVMVRNKPKTPQELRQSNTVAGTLTLEWLELFEKKAKGGR